MKRKPNICINSGDFSSMLKTAAGLLLVGGLAACGGGGSGGSDTADVASPFTLSGTAATGAAFAGATVTLTDGSGNRFPAGITGADGNYTITVPASAKPPFIVQAVRDDKTLVSVFASAKNSTLNITPLTNLIASRLSVSGDPLKLAEEVKANPALFDAAKLDAKVTEVVALVKPVMDAVGDTTNPLTGTLVADGTGHDRVLDSLAISITPSSATSVNIEVSVKQKTPDGADPAVIAFTNNTKPATAVATVAAADLVPSGTAPLIQDLLGRLTACYALSQAERVTSGGTAAADIKAPACKTIFAGDDPANFKNNGVIVSSKGAFSSIYSPATGVKFDRGSYEFTRGNGDLVIAYRATDSSNNSANNTLVVKTDSDGKFKMIGNQYQYSGSVAPRQMLNSFVNQPEATYYSTGYSLLVGNTLDAKGNPIFAKVVVSNHKGGEFTLKPAAGVSNLQLVRSTGEVTRTTVLRIRNVYADAANKGDPALADIGGFTALTRATDAEIAAFAGQSVWKFDYYLVGNATTTPDATQYYRTRARPLTIAELQTQALATLTDADIANIKAKTVTNASGGRSFPTPATGPVTLNWVVPADAFAPTSIQLLGSANSIPFTTTATVAPGSFTRDIVCTAASAADTHCTAGNYGAGGWLVGIQLLASSPTGREFATYYPIYTVTIP